jgi:hypothetical protein
MTCVLLQTMTVLKPHPHVRRVLGTGYDGLFLLNPVI